MHSTMKWNLCQKIASRPERQNTIIVSITTAATILIWLKSYTAKCLLFFSSNNIVKSKRDSKKIGHINKVKNWPVWLRGANQHA